MTLLYAIIFLVVIPLFFWSRIKYVNKRRDSVKSQCPNCKHIQRLDAIENYTCINCGTNVVYINELGARIDDDVYNCSVCGTANLNGIVNCTICGKVREEE